MVEPSLHHEAVVVDGHNHIMIELAQRRTRGEQELFKRYFGPRLRAAGIDVVMLVVGGDGGSLNNGSDLALWGPLWIMDMLWQEADESSDIIAICRNTADIDEALRRGKIAILLTMEGGRALEGKPNIETLAGLRTFYRLGLRELQLVDNPRNKMGDGKGESRTKGGLSNFGIAVVKEMNRLGMLINVSHLTEPGFWDVIENSRDPIVDSHSNCRAVCDHPRNITDEQIRAIASKGGVVGLSCWSALVSRKRNPRAEDLVEHVDHVANLVGVDYVGLGPDFADMKICSAWTGGRGWMEGVFYGDTDQCCLEDVDTIDKFPVITDTLLKRGYRDEDIAKILGGNLLRLYREVIG